MMNFIGLLNHVRTAELNDRNVKLLKSKFVDSNDDYQKDALHIFAENIPANISNITILESIDHELYSIQAIDDLSKNVAASKIEQVLNQNQSDIDRLAGMLKVKLNTRVMLNVNSDKKLVNGQLGAIKHILKDGTKFYKNMY